MNDLVEFLLARIEEDEEEARVHPDAVNWPDGVTPIGGLYTWVGRDGSYGTGITEGHLLAECEAKRRIVEVHQMVTEDYRHSWWVTSQTDDELIVTGCDNCRSAGVDGDDYLEAGPCATLRLLSLPYSDHPAYRPEWCP